MKIKGTWTITIDGRRIKVENMIMNNLTNAIGNGLSQGGSFSPCAALRIGDGTTAPSPTQTALAHQTGAFELAQSVYADRQYVATAIVRATDSDLTVREMGAFDSNGRMLSRVLADATKPAASIMILEWALTMTDE